jgi:hypothetical protein
MQITILFEGKSFDIRGLPTHRIEQLYSAIENLTSIREEYLRGNLYHLHFDGEKLWHTQTLGELEMEDGDTINLFRTQTGMISSWTTTDTSDPLTEYLMLSDAERPAPTPRLLELLKSKAGWDIHLDFEIQETGDTVLSGEQRQRCIAFLDAAQTSLAPGSADLKITLSGGEALGAVLRDDEGPTKFRQLQGMHKSPHGSKIALRRTEGPVDGCIGFHKDGGYATHTVQLTLNDDSAYEGGRLCFFSGNRLAIPARPAGTLTKHEPRVLHGVTRLYAGVRYSLFVADHANGLGQEDVFDLNESQAQDIVTAMIAKKVPKTI